MWVTDGRRFVALRYICTQCEDSCHRNRISVLPATVHHCHTVETHFNEESVTSNQRCSLCTDGAPAVFGACKGGGNFVLSLEWRILASGGCQRSWLLWRMWSLKQFILKEPRHLKTDFPTIYGQILAPSAGRSGRPVYGVGLWPLACWDHGFESHRRSWMFVCCECCVLSDRGLCDELITRPEKSYRLWCVVVCDLETSGTRRPWLALGRSATG